jgi:eukaryotic-like serine/threonine-protein kinase
MGRIEVALERGGNGATERIVALKRLLPESARDPRRKEMFLREARLGALLAHPNVVRAFAFGEIYDELFLAMEYVEGEPLSRVLSAVRDTGHTLGAALTCHVLAEVCEGLHAAHELADAHGKPLNVVHRDVSPQNVIIAYDGQVKLLDFGVAKLDSTEHQTRTGEVKGKMAYMSPEQALGDKLDRRSDLFSLGAVLFECLTGRTMWGTGTDVELMRKLALEHPPLLDSADGRIAPELAALQGRLVARGAEMRPATALEVARELRGCRADFPTPQDAKAALVLLMGELFGQAAVDRRSLLAEALVREAPSRVEALRRTLEPGAVLRQPSLAEPVLVSAPPPPPRKTRRGAVVTGIVLATVAVSAVVAAGARRAPAESPSASAPATTAPSNILAIASAAGTTPGGATSVVATTSARSADRPSPASETQGRVRPTRPAAPPAATRPGSPSSLRAGPAAPIKAHDVDPSPF